MFCTLTLQKYTIITKFGNFINKNHITFIITDQIYTFYLLKFDLIYIVQFELHSKIY